MQRADFIAVRAKGRGRRFLGLLPAFFALLAVTFMPGASVQGARDGLELCFTSIVPSLFPFFVLSSMLFQMGLPAYIGRFTAPVMKRLFGVSGEGAAAFIIGITGGYPLGAKAVSDIYQRGGCTKDEAERMLGFCNNSGPAFILGVAGAGVFGRPDIGILLYITHVAAAVAVGILTRPGGAAAPAPEKRGAAPPPAPFAEVFTDSIKSSFASCLNICGFVVFFSVLLGLLQSLGLFTRLSQTPLAESLLIGLLELGNGMASLKGLSGAGAVSLSAFILGWGGLSVHAQVLAVTGSAKFSPARLIACRALHGIIAAALTAAAYLLIM